MPARQLTPGSNTLKAPDNVLRPHIIQKRTFSEILPDDEPRLSKKYRKELEILNNDDKNSSNSNSHKDSKKKRKKRRRKSSLTNSEIDPVKQIPKSITTAVPASVASSSTLSEASMLLPIMEVEADHNVLRAESLAMEADERPALTAADKGKGRAILGLSDDTSLVQGYTAIAGPPHETDPLKDAQAQIAVLCSQLQCQKVLLSRYEDNLSHLQQSLTCEICLDLLYKPFSLSPCGHVACYVCLIRWFTSIQNHGGDADNDQYEINPPVESDDIPTLLSSRAATRGAFLRNRKTCPLCRASITSRPAEVWSIKGMVVNLIKSNLVNLPSAPPTSARDTPGADAFNSPRNDPWRNVFPKPRHQQPHFYPPPPENNEGDQEWDTEDMGMYDAEDGGIYRCLSCMHEIWGGVCTNCNREYRGHARLIDDNDDGDHVDGDDGDEFLGRNANVLGRRLREIIQAYDEPVSGWGPEDDEDADDDINSGVFYDAHDDLVELTDDESVSNEGSDQGPRTAEEEWTTEEEDGEPNIHHSRNLPLWRGIDMLRGMSVFSGLHAYGGSASAAHIEEIADGENVSEWESDRSHPDSEVDYEGSFIDDGESGHDFYDYGEDDDDGDGWSYHHRYGGYEVEDDESDDPGYGSVARRLGRGLRLDGGGPHPPTVRRLDFPRNSTRGIDDDEEDNDEAPCAGPSRSRRVRRQAHRAFLDSEDEDEDGTPVSLYRRNVPSSGMASNRRRRPRTRLYDDNESE